VEPPKLIFEEVDSDYVIRRAKVPGGWLVLGGHGVTFIQTLTISGPLP
jgi:hypothetical protein